MNILVTGGAGYIGSHTVVELVRAGYTPIIIDDFRNSDKSSLEGIAQILGFSPKTHIGDCADTTFVESVFSQDEIDGVIHFAAIKSVGESMTNPLSYYRNNIGSLVTVLEATLRHGTRAFVFSSSATVYGEPDVLPITESAPRKPANSTYGNTKQICEDILRETTIAADGRLRSISLRYFNPIGAHETGLIGELPLGIPNNLVPYLTQAAAGIREQLTIFGDDYPTHDGTCIRDYIHVVDLADAHISTLKHLFSSDSDRPAYDVYNVGTGHGTSVQELIDTFERETGVKVPSVVGPRRTGDVASVYADPGKIERDFGWKTRLSVAQALKDSWRWQQNLENKI
jgi:UDP-glucose 4-epimerase